MQWLIPMTVGAIPRDSPGLYRRGSISSTYKASSKTKVGSIFVPNISNNVVLNYYLRLKNIIFCVPCVEQSCNV